ncbi:MAG: sigma-70 family RNA polymerase sigma factor [Anaerolineales bacterium]
MNSTVPITVTDLELVDCTNNKPATFAAVYDFYFSRVYMYIRYRVGDPSVADDLTSKAFEQALKKLDTYSPKRAPFAAWMFTIARNAVNDHLRAMRRHPSLPFDALFERRNNDDPPEEMVVQQEEKNRLLRAVARLKERDRELIALKFATGLTNRQIAEILSLTEKNVSVILYRAIRDLRVHLKAME